MAGWQIISSDQSSALSTCALEQAEIWNADPKLVRESDGLTGASLA